MRYILYILTLALVFSAGMMIGNTYLPEHGVSLATAVSAPDLDSANPILSATDRANAEKELAVISEALQICPMVAHTDKDLLVNHIKLWLALEDFELKKAHLELEIAKNSTSNRATMQFVQATSEYNAARAYAEKLAEELFPSNQELAVNPTQVTTLISTATAAPAAAPVSEQPAAETEPQAVAEPMALTPENVVVVTEKETAKAAEITSAEVKAETKPAENVADKKASVPAAAAAAAENKQAQTPSATETPQEKPQEKAPASPQDQPETK